VTSIRPAAVQEAVVRLAHGLEHTEDSPYGALGAASAPGGSVKGATGIR
jgi:hypothetical protein